VAQRTTPPFRADHVGSLLRPQRLIQARVAKLRLIVETAQEVWG
jgi:5-methyltetrahydropteroyltriglutamate--homocysteine methyltransferase